MKLLFAMLLRNAVAAGVATFLLNLSSPTNATIVDGQGVATIQTNPIIPSVTLSRTTGKAPLAVGFDATGTVGAQTTNPSHDLYYIWSFGDAAGETWAYGATVGLDKNAAYGPVAGHVFKSAGTFNWQLTIIDGRGNVATSSGAITVSDWVAADTIYIANGSLPSAGGEVLSGATYYNETTWAGVASRFSANKRIRLLGTSTWACAATTVVPAGCQIDSYGGSIANITSSGSNMCPFDLNAGQSDVRVCNVKHTGPGAGAGIINSFTVHTSNTTPSNLLILGVESTASTSGFTVESPEINNIFIQDCHFHDFGTTGAETVVYAAYITKAYGAYILGSFFDQTPYHAVRVGGGNRVVVDSCKFRDVDGLGGGRHALTIRGWGETGTWSGIYTQDVVVSNNDIDTVGTTAQYNLHIQPTNTSVAAKFRRILVERNLIKGDGRVVQTQVSETLTVRSNILVTTGDTADDAMSLGNDSIVGNPDPVGAQFYNNTIYSAGTGAFKGISFGSTVTGCTVRNTLVYAPNATTPTVLEMLGTSTDTVRSNNSSDAQILGTRPWTLAAPVNPVDFTPVNYAIGAGYAHYRCQKDFFNTTMDAPVEIGAVNV